MIFVNQIPKLNQNHKPNPKGYQPVSGNSHTLPLNKLVLKISSDRNRIRYRQSVQDKNENLKEFSVQGAALAAQSTVVLHHEAGSRSNIAALFPVRPKHGADGPAPPMSE